MILFHDQFYDLDYKPNKSSALSSPEILSFHCEEGNIILFKKPITGFLGELYEIHKCSLRLLEGTFII